MKSRIIFCFEKFERKYFYFPNQVIIHKIPPTFANKSDCSHYQWHFYKISLLSQNFFSKSRTNTFGPPSKGLSLWQQGFKAQQHLVFRSQHLKLPEADHGTTARFLIVKPRQVQQTMIHVKKMNDSCCYPGSLIDVFPFYCFLPLPSCKIYPVTHTNELGEISNEGKGGTVHKYSQSQSNNLRFIFPLKKQTTFPDHFQIHSLIL